jgi:hypothetical protein
MLDLASWLDIDDSVYREEADFKARNITRPAKNRLLHKVAMKVNRRFESFFYSHPGLKNLIKSVYFKLNGKKKKDSISPDDIAYLERLYLPKNRELADILQRHGFEDLPDWLA